MPRKHPIYSLETQKSYYFVCDVSVRLHYVQAHHFVVKEALKVIKEFPRFYMRLLETPTYARLFTPFGARIVTFPLDFRLCFKAFFIR